MAIAGRVHVIGGGLAGLSAALSCAQSGRPVTLYEAAPVLGGRCRSFHDPVLDRIIDTGTHLMLGANRAALGLARAIGGMAALRPGPACFDIVDRAGVNHPLTTGTLPAGWRESLRALGLPWCPAGQDVAARLGDGAAFGRCWEPLCLAALNTSPHQASARLFGRVLRAAVAHGAASLRPWRFALPLSAAFADPAATRLAALGAEIRLGHRLRHLSTKKLTFVRTEVALPPRDRVILAVPPAQAARLLPGLPDLPTQPIANVHFRLPHRPAWGNPVGLTGRLSQWLSVRGDVASVTISAAGAVMDWPAAALAAAVWADIAPLVGGGVLPPWRVIRDAAATLRHDPATLAARPGPLAGPAGVILAGDWTASPWPCTIEAAVRSGQRAARLALKSQG